MFEKWKQASGAAFIAATLMLGSSIASAMPVTFEFDPIENGNADTGSLGPDETFALGGKSVTVSAFLLSPVSTGTWVAADIRRNTNNNGNDYRLGIRGDRNAIDTVGDKIEGLLFDFGPSGMAALEIDFTTFSTSETALIYTGNLITGSGIVGNPKDVGLDFIASASGATDPFIFATPLKRQFLFVTSADTGSSTSTFDRFRITSVTAVPEPGTLALFGLGLAGLGLARRRKVA